MFVAIEVSRMKNIVLSRTRSEISLPKTYFCTFLICAARSFALATSPQNGTDPLSMISVVWQWWLRWDTCMLFCFLCFCWESGWDFIWLSQPQTQRSLSFKRVFYFWSIVWEGVRCNRTRPRAKCATTSPPEWIRAPGAPNCKKRVNIPCTYTGDLAIEAPSPVFSFPDSIYAMFFLCVGFFPMRGPHQRFWSFSIVFFFRSFTFYLGVILNCYTPSPWRFYQIQPPSMKPLGQ